MSLIDLSDALGPLDDFDLRESYATQDISHEGDDDFVEESEETDESIFYLIREVKHLIFKNVESDLTSEERVQSPDAPLQYLVESAIYHGRYFLKDQVDDFCRRIRAAYYISDDEGNLGAAAAFLSAFRNEKELKDICKLAICKGDMISLMQCQCYLKLDMYKTFASHILYGMAYGIIQQAEGNDLSAIVVESRPGDTEEKEEDAEDVWQDPFSLRIFTDDEDDDTNADFHDSALSSLVPSFLNDEGNMSLRVVSDDSSHDTEEQMESNDEDDFNFSDIFTERTIDDLLDDESGMIKDPDFHTMLGYILALREFMDLLDKPALKIIRDAFEANNPEEERKIEILDAMQQDDRMELLLQQNFDIVFTDDQHEISAYQKLRDVLLPNRAQDEWFATLIDNLADEYDEV